MSRFRFQAAPKLNFVEPARVFSEYRLFMLFPEIVPFDDLIDLLHAVVERDFVRKVGGEHERFGADPLDGIGEGFLIALAADEYFTAGKIIHRFALDP